MPRLQLLHGLAIGVECYHLGGGFLQVLVACEGVGCAFVIEQLVHFEFACGASGVFLLLHGGVKACFINGNAALAAYVLRQV